MTPGALPARRTVAAVITLLAVLFPALTAGSGIDQPARDSELTWLRLAAGDPEGRRGGPASLFVRALLDEDVADDPAALREALGVARLASVFGVLACSGLLYLGVMLARGRGIATLSCLAFGLLPPVWSEGAILRPEVPVTMFGLLALLLLIGLPERLRAARREHVLAGWTSLLAIGVAVATADALAVATMPLYGVHLLVPAACMLIVVVQQSVLFVRVLRRFRFLVLPFGAFTLRTLPWLLPALLGLGFSALLLSFAPGPEQTTAAGSGLLSETIWVAVACIAFAVVGGLVRLLQVGLEIGRRPRLAAAAVLAVHVLILLLQRLRLGSFDDALPAAPALAVLMAEGVGVAMLFGGARLGGLRRRPTAGDHSRARA